MYCHLYLAVAEKMMGQDIGTPDEDLIAPTMRKRSHTPPEELASDDEAMYVEQEEREDKRMEDNDPDYEYC